MLLEHFKLGVQPFGVTPNGRFLYLSPTHREAIASLLYEIQLCRGFTALIALPGMGKTTVLLHVLSLLRGNARTAFLFQTLCGPEQFLRSLLADLGIDDEGGDVARMHAKLNAYLLQESKGGRQVIVVIDEAQNLDERVLELVRMLSNFETPAKKLMHLILCGQPQLAEKLASERLTQLRQRISIVARLTPFNADETREYIDHRLRVGGAAPENTIFSRQAYAMIAAQSGGIPRNINNLCFNAMSLACALKKPQVDALMVREAIDDLNLATLIPAKDSSAIRVKQTPVLTMMPWLSLSNSWRYSTGIAIVFLVALGLLAYNGMPSRERLMSEHAASGPQPEVIREPKAPAASKTIAPEDLSDQVVPSIAQRKPMTAERSIHANGIQSLHETAEIRLLPGDLERLQHAQNSEPPVRRQDPAQNDAAPKHGQVPAEPIPQSEKR
jgi:type II secretory pathway predicted ATPase ExeA